MAAVDVMLDRVPSGIRHALLKHRELLKFAFVGGITWVIFTGLWYLLKLTVLRENPVTAGLIAVIVATVVSYLLNREWSFRTRAGREAHHEALLFFLISGVAMFFQLLPLYLSRYLFHFETPYVSPFNEQLADFISGSIVGILLAMFFRFWAFKKWVFPDDLGKRRRA